MIILLLLLFVFWPLGGFLAALKVQSSKRVQCLFTVFYFGYIGYNIRYVDTLCDASVYAERFELLQGLSIMQVLFTNASGMFDVFSSITMYLVGILTTDPSFLFAFWGMLYGFVVYQTMWFITHKLSTSSKYFLLLFIFYMINPHSNINGMRFWFATWVWLYSFIRIIESGSYRWLLLMLLTIFIHNSMIIPVFVYIVYIVYKYFNFNHSTLMSIILLSFLIGNIIPIADILSEIPFIAGNEHYSMYVDSDNVADFRDNNASKSFVYTFVTNLPFYIGCPVLLYLGILLNKYTGDINMRNIHILYSLCALFYIFDCFFRNVPSFGRFSCILYMLFIYLLILLIEANILRNVKLISLGCLSIFLGKIYITYLTMNQVLKIAYIYPTFFN